jgi:hypothetical protein
MRAGFGKSGRATPVFDSFVDLIGVPGVDIRQSGFAVRIPHTLKQFNPGQEIVKCVPIKS